VSIYWWFPPWTITTDPGLAVLAGNHKEELNHTHQTVVVVVAAAAAAVTVHSFDVCVLCVRRYWHVVVWPWRTLESVRFLLCRYVFFCCCVWRHYPGSLPCSGVLWSDLSLCCFVTKHFFTYLPVHSKEIVLSHFLQFWNWTEVVMNEHDINVCCCTTIVYSLNLHLEVILDAWNTLC